MPRPPQSELMISLLHHGHEAGRALSEPCVLVTYLFLGAHLPVMVGISRLVLIGVIPVAVLVLLPLLVPALAL